MKKSYEEYIIYGLLVLVIGGLVWTVMDFFKDKSDISSSITVNDNKKGTANSQVESSFKTIATGSTNTGDVSIELTPQEINNGKLKVAIAVNTHSVDLSQFDFKQITSLEYNGKSVKPISVPTFGGHHSNGVLVFDVEQELNLFTIKIKGIPKVENRVFTWQIQK